jgi:hypothetical protein
MSIDGLALQTPDRGARRLIGDRVISSGGEIRSDNVEYHVSVELRVRALSALLSRPTGKTLRTHNHPTTLAANPRSPRLITRRVLRRASMF